VDPAGDLARVMVGRMDDADCRMKQFANFLNAHAHAAQVLGDRSRTSRAIMSSSPRIALTGFAHLEQIVLGAYDRIVGLILTDIAVDGCITKAPGGGDCAGRSPVDR
jgi:hypothetical protein